MHAQLKSLQSSPNHLRRTLTAAIRSLALVSGFPEDKSGQHSDGVSRTASQIALALGLRQSQVGLIGPAASLHDVGKVAVPDQILLKPGPLTPEEFEIIKSHTVEGALVLSAGRSPLLQLAGEIALYHHERWDGGGYFHLRGDAIPLSARIVAVADVFDALTHPRVYKPVWTTERALEHLQKERDRAFEGRLVDAFFCMRAGLGLEP